MSLTKSDLKAIGDLFDNNFDAKIVEKKLVTRDDFINFATKRDLKSLEAKMATKKGLKKIEERFDELFDFLDKDYIRVKSDVREIQSHFRLPVTAY